MLFVVIPVHDRLTRTRACLASLVSQDVDEVTIVVVDDGSTDETPVVVARDFPQVETLTGDGSLWWGGAMNLGVGWVLERADADDLVLTLNNDTTAPPGYLDTLLRAARAHPRALIGSLAVRADDPDRIVDAGAIVDWRCARYRTPGRGGSLAALRAQRPPFVAVSVLSGRGTIVPVRAYRRLGLYAAALPHYGADYEFARRAQRAGWEILLCNDAILTAEQRATGLHDAMRPLTLRETITSLSSIKSPNSLRYRWRFARLAAPPESPLVFFVLDCLRIVGGRVRRLLRRATP